MSKLQHALEAQCGAPPSGWGFTPTGSVTVDFIHSATGSLLHYRGEVGVDLVAHDLGFDATIPAGIGCDATVSLAPVKTVLRYAKLKIPIAADLGWKVTINTAHEAKVHVRANFDIKLLVTLDGHHLDADAFASGSAAGSSIDAPGVTVTTGPTGSIGFDFDRVKATIDGYFPVIGEWPASGGCRIAAGAFASISAEGHIPILHLDGSFSWARNVERSLYKCGAPEVPPSPPASSTCAGDPCAVADGNDDVTVEFTPTPAREVCLEPAAYGFDKELLVNGAWEARSLLFLSITPTTAGRARYTFAADFGGEGGVPGDEVRFRVYYSCNEELGAKGFEVGVTNGITVR